MRLPFRASRNVCPACGKPKAREVTPELVKKPSQDDEGIKLRRFLCQACKQVTTKEVRLLPRSLVRPGAGQCPYCDEATFVTKRKDGSIQCNCCGGVWDLRQDAPPPDQGRKDSVLEGRFGGGRSRGVGAGLSY